MHFRLHESLRGSIRFELIWRACWKEEGIVGG